METTLNKTVNRPATVKPAASAPVLSRKAVSIQTALKVSSPKDPAEKEAESTAQKIMRMAVPESSVATVPGEKGGVFRQIKKDDKKPKLLRSPYVARFIQPSVYTQKNKEEEKKAPKPLLNIARFFAGIFTKKEKKEEEKIQRKEEASQKIKTEEKDKKPILRSPYIARFQNTGIFTQKEKEDKKIQRKQSEGQPNVSANVAADIQNSMSSGNPLPLSIRRFMEPRFKADFSTVKIHTNDKSAKLNKQLKAQAFTVGNNIFFGKNRFKPDQHEGRELIAHELTHTIQQGTVAQRSEDTSVSQTSNVQVQRLGLSDALDYFADKANNIPGFRMFTIILGVNPINMSKVDRSAANILRAVIEFIPGGGLITQALDNHGIIDKVANWVSDQIATLGMIGGSIKQAISDFLDTLSWRDIFDLGGVWNRAKKIFTDPIDRIINFVKGLVTGIIKFIKDAILRPLARLAEGTRGYDLLKAILGEDPVTGDPVPRNADTLIGGFMKLIGQEEIWNNLKKANAVARAWAWFQGAMTALMGFVRQIPQLFIRAFTSLELMDIIVVPRAFAKIVSVFGSFIGQFISWAGNAVWNLLEIIFAVVAPGVMPYIKKAAAAFRTILKNPIGFVGNLVRAGKLGFQQFADNIVNHLKTALIKWLTGPLGEAGVYIPQSFSLLEIIKLVLSILGLTWQNIRTKLLRIIPEPVLVVIEKTASILVTLVRDGPAAAWEQIKAELTELKDQLISQVIQMVTTEIVKAAVIKLVSMLNPAGAIIQAIIAIYNTVTFFIQKINQIAAVVASFIDSIAAIASGQVGAAANKVEQTMANTLTVVIGFLAKFAGLGNIPEKLVGVVKKIRQPIDKGLDKIVAWLGNMLKKMGSAVAQAGLPQDPNERLRLGMQAAVTAVNRFAGRAVGALVLTPLLAGIKIRYGFRTLEVFPQPPNWGIRGHINPTAILGTRVIVRTETDRETQTQRQTTHTIIATAKVINFEFRRFTANQSVSIREMTEGLQHHQTALNNLTIEQWMTNIYARPYLRGAYAAEQRDIARKELIRNLRTQIIDEYRERGITLTTSQLYGLIAMRARGTHASHSADFISGGDIDKFDSLERGAVNSYVGSNWGRIRPDLESYWNNLRIQYEPRVRPLVKMNFRLRAHFLN